MIEWRPSKLAAFDVYTPATTPDEKPKWIERVFYGETMTDDAVKSDLINHDGMPYNIIVRRETK